RFRVHRSHQQCVARPREPGPAEVETPYVGDDDTKCRVQCDRQHGGHDHGQSLGVGEGLKSRPSCASSVSTGRKETAITSKAKKLGPATCLTALTITGV